MIRKVGQVMLYVDNQDQARNFWTEKLGFQVVAEEDDGQGMRWIEIAPPGADTTIVLQNKEFVAKMSPGLNLGTPSLMFYTDDADRLHEDLKNKNVKVGELMDIPSGRVFNFADDEENYFAVMTRK